MKISVCLIGEDSLLIQCGKILLKGGHSIVVVVSSVSRLQDWAKENNILYVSKIDELFDHHFVFDYLFSIVNSFILSNAVIGLARCAAINYHDSPLPKYAGLNATSWALMHGEKQHGVSWHLMDQRIDTGNIVYQQLFNIDSEETAFSLNLKCYQTASESFERLLSKLEQGKLCLSKQSIDNRTYYARDHLLPNLGFIDCYSQTAEEIQRIYAALSVGDHPNTIGTLKVYLNKYYFIISKLELVEESICCQQKSGVLFYSDSDAIYVSTKKGSIKLIELIGSENTVVSAKKLINSFGIGVGYQLPKLKDLNKPTLKMLYKSALRKERESVSKLSYLQEHAVFKSVGQLESVWINQPSLDFSELLANKDNDSILLGAILIYLYRLNNYEAFSVFFVHRKLHTQQNHCAGLFSIFFPYLFKISDDFSLQEIINFISKSNLENEPIYLTDLLARYPTLNNKSISPAIVINFTNPALTSVQLPEETCLYIQINRETAKIQAFFRQPRNSQSMNQLPMFHFNEHISEIVLALIKSPNLSITRLTFLSESEKKTLLNWGTGKKYSLPALSIIELFEKQVQLRPEQIAITVQDISVTYYQLWAMSNTFASYIYSLDCANQSRIGIYFSRSVEMLAAILGVLKTNSTYIPIDIHYPLQRVKYIIQETSLHLVITQEVFLTRLKNLFQDQPDSVFLASDQSILNTVHPTPKNLDFHENNLAYILFTSGTTGKPKGVMVTQKNIVNYCYWFLDSTHFNSSSTMDFSSSIGFDLSIPCTLAPLLAGGKIAICTEQAKTNPKHYLAHLKHCGVTHLEITPGYFNLLLQYPEEICELLALKYLLLGADALCKSDIVKWLEYCPRHILINEYGPTETTVAVTSYFIQADKLGHQSSVPIGGPGYNTQCFVLDKYSNLCPIGMTGELYIGGQQVTCGYLNKAEITKQQFVSVAAVSKEKLYKSGDAVIWSPTGFLYFLGRTDRQIKIKGYRVELLEIECVLLTMPGIQRATVALSQTGKNSGNLIAYLVSNKMFKNDQAIRNYLLQRLPKFMLPKQFAIVTKMPMKENEKIDQAVLEKMHKFIIPSYTRKKNCSDMAETIKLIWQAAFNKVITIQIEDNFFDLGGDSLTAIQILDALQDQYNIDISLYALFKYPTIAELEIEINRLLNHSHSNSHKKERKLKVAILKRKALSIVPLAKGSSECPLFLIHPVGGTVFWYQPMAAFFQGKYTVYGIQDPNIDNHAIHFSTLEEMAAYYLNDIKKIQPSSEQYNLAGASFGATVAFEIANQLLQENKRVSFLGAFDGWACYPDQIIQNDTSTLLLNQSPTYLKLDKKRQAQLLMLEEHRKKLLNAYELPYLKLDLCLFKAKELWPLFQSIENEYNGWRAHVGGELSVYTVSGTHETMFFEPFVYDLVNTLKPLLVSITEKIKKIG